MLNREDFQGTWRIRRDITDRLAGQSGHLMGEAGLTDVGQGVLKYTESGELRLGNGPVFTATRDYKWHFQNNMVVVTFADGSDFHSFTPQGHVSGTDHPCGDDSYAVRYDFRSWPRWQAIWTVSGPRKDYTSVTNYDRP